MRFPYVIFLLLNSIFASSVQADCLNVDAAKSLYTQAQGKAAEDAIKLLDKSANQCENYAVYYTLGLNHLKLQHAKPALDSFKKAQHFVPISTEQEAILLGRMAIAYYQLNDFSTALAAIDAGYAVFQSKQLAAPNWLMEIRKDIDLAWSNTLFKADKINETLLTMKSFGVQPKINIKILFATRSDVIEDKALAQVKELAKALLTQVGNGQKILIIGHTDKRGDTPYNQKLSEQRAQSVVRQLISTYPELQGSITAKGVGFSQLRYQGNHESVHKLNRRVEVRVM